MPKPTILFKAAALMVVRHPATAKDRAMVQVIGSRFPVLNLHPEAAALLLDYLVVARAFFHTCREGRQKLKSFCIHLQEALHEAGEDNTIAVPGLRKTMRKCGSLTDWVQLYSPDNF